MLKVLIQDVNKVISGGKASVEQFDKELNQAIEDATAYLRQLEAQTEEDLSKIELVNRIPEIQKEADRISDLIKKTVEKNKEPEFVSVEFSVSLQNLYYRNLTSQQEMLDFYNEQINYRSAVIQDTKYQLLALKNKLSELNSLLKDL